MNIRSVSNPGQVRAQDKIESDRRDLKSDQATDRDGNGQQAFGDGSGYRSLTEEELQQVLDKLKKHKGILKNSLSVVLTFEGKLPFISIETLEGQRIKKLNEKQLFEYLFQDVEDVLSLVRRVA